MRTPRASRHPVRLLTALLLLGGSILQVASTSAAPQRVSDQIGSPGGASAQFDVLVRSDSPTALTVKWFPPPISSTSYQVTVTDLATNQQRVATTTSDTQTTFDALDLTHEFTIIVRQLRADGTILPGSAEERWSMPVAPSAKASTQAALSVQIATLDPGNFPLIFGTARVLKGGQLVNDLPASAYSIFEDGRIQTRSFNITLPGVGGDVRAADIVFLIDNSGSMGDKQTQVKAQVNQFVSAMVAQGIDFRLGLVKFGQAAYNGDPVVVNGGALTADVAAFSGWLNQMTVDGGTEPGIATVRAAATQMTFRAGVPRVFLLITDEESDGGDLVSTANICVANNITVHCAVDCTYGSSFTDYCGTSGIAPRTGGQVFPVQGPYSDILNSIGSSVAATYVFQYETDNPALDGTTRQVRLDVADEGDAGSATASYRPGAAPVIRRTAATIALGGSALTAGQTITIAATVTDAVAPFIQGVQLHFRRVGTATFAVKSMNAGGAGLYQAGLSGTDIASPGLQYYISASDGQVTTSDPSLDPARVPYDIAVLPNVAPQVTHSAPASVSVGLPLALTAEVVDVTNRVASVQIIYRRGGTLIDKSVAMARTSGDQYVGTIPGADVGITGVAYRIRATDDLGVSTEVGPFAPTASAEAVLRFGVLEFRADAITAQGDGTKLLSGHVRVNDVLKFGGDIKVDPLNLVASGSGQVYVDATIARITLFDGDFHFGILGTNGKLTDFLSQGVPKLLPLAGLQFKLKDLELLADGVRVSGTLDLGMGSVDRKTSLLTIDINKLEATQSNGLQLDGCATVPNLTLKGAIGLKDTKFCLDTFKDVFAGGTTAVTPLISVGGDFVLRAGQLDRVGLTVGDLQVPIGSTGLFLTGGDGAVDHLTQPPVEISLHVDIAGGPQVNGTYIAELRKLGITVQAPEYLSGSGDLYVFGVKGAGGSISYMKAGIDAQLDLSLAEVLETTLKAHLTHTEFTGSADGTLQIPDGNGFPLNLVKKVVSLPYKISSSSNTIDKSKIEGTFTLPGPTLPIIGQIQLDFAHRLSYAPPKIEFALGTDLEHLQTLLSFSAAAQVMMPASTAAVSAGLPLSFPVPDGQRQLILAVHGADGAPPVMLITPDGTQLESLQPATWSQGHAFWFDNGDPQVSFWVVDHPLGGQWTAFVDNRERALDSLVVYGSVDRPQLALGTPVQGSTISLKWWAKSRGPEAKLSFYYDTDASGFDGQLVASDIDAGAGQGTFTWNPAGIRTGRYYLLGRLDDGRNPAVYQYARIPVQVTEAGAPAPPVLKRAGQTGNAIELEWDPSPSLGIYGYAVVYGTDTQGDPFPNSRAYGDTTQATLDNLMPGRSYRCAVYAFTEDGRRSVPSETMLVEFHSTTGNNLPEIITHPRERVILGREFRYEVGVRDLDGEVPTISLRSAPAGMSVNPQGVITWTPQAGDLGRHLVAIAAVDGRGGEDMQTFTLTVAPEYLGRGRLTLDRKLYVGAGTVATIQVDDLDLDANPTVIDSVHAVVWSSQVESQQDVTLFETGVSTGRFRGVVFMSSGDGSAPILSVPSGGLFHARYDDTLPAQACLDSAIWVARLPVPAQIDVDPNTLNLKSLGTWVTAYVTLPPPLDPRRIDLREVSLCGQIAAVNKDFGVGDVNGDGIAERVVKFDRETVASAIRRHTLSPNHLWLTGRMYSGVAALDFAGGDSIRTVKQTLQEEPLSAAVPGRVEGIRPNPFQRSVEIQLRLEQNSVADVSVYEVSGRRVRTVMSGSWPAGQYTLDWDGRNERGDVTPAGLYFIRVKAGSRESVYRVVRLGH